MGNTRPALPDLRKLDTVDKIRLYYQQDGVRLTKFEMEKVVRYKAMFKLMVEEGETTEKIRKYRQLFDVSQRTYYIDLREAEMVYGELRKVNKDAQRLILNERIEKALKSCLEKDEEKGTIRIGNLEMYEKLLNLQARINRLDQDDPGIPDFDNMDKAPIFVGIFPEILKTPLPESDEELQREIERLSKPKKARSSDADYTEYEEVKDDE